MNRNYQAGRREEYACVKRLRAQGYDAQRSAGSHGKFDVWAVRNDTPSLYVQCKVTEKESVAKKLLADFKANPPLTPSKFYHQRLEVRIKGSSTILEWTL